MVILDLRECPLGNSNQFSNYKGFLLYAREIQLQRYMGNDKSEDWLTYKELLKVMMQNWKNNGWDLRKHSELGHMGFVVSGQIAF